METTETPTSSNQTNNTISSPDASVVLLGYSDYQTTDTSFSFFIYFTSLLNSISSRTLRFPINIQYNSALRHLDDKESVALYKAQGQNQSFNINVKFKLILLIILNKYRSNQISISKVKMLI